MKVTIVGGGITGLAAAWRLQQLRPDAVVTVFEAGERLGGKLRTERIAADEGVYLCEAGAESFVRRTSEMWRMVCDVGAHRAARTVSDAVGMHIVRRGKILRVPLSPLEFLRSPLMSARGKLRMLSEPLRPGRNDDGDETMASFVTRRFGREALDEIIGPVIGGIFNADPETQSVEMSMASMRVAERRGGSVVRGMLRAPRRDPDLPRGAFLFEDGVEGFIDALLRKSACEVRLRTPVHSLRCAANGAVGVDSAGGASTCDAVVLAVPTRQAAMLLADVAPDASRALGEIEHQPIGTLVMTYRADDVPVKRDVRGVIVPRREKRTVDAVMFASHKRPECAPHDHALLRVFVGGARPDLVDRDDDAMIDAVRSDLSELFGITAAPRAVRVNRWQDGFVRAVVGHRERVTRIRRSLPHNVFIAGASYDGIGAPDCVRSGFDCAELIASSPA
jgi:oxygen-dependent protoporphyrinogen oxidase